MEESLDVSFTALFIVLTLLIFVVFWLTSEETQDWLQLKYYKYRIKKIEKKNKKWEERKKWKKR